MLIHLKVAPLQILILLNRQWYLAIGHSQVLLILLNKLPIAIQLILDPLTLKFPYSTLYLIQSQCRSLFDLVDPHFHGCVGVSLVLLA